MSSNLDFVSQSSCCHQARSCNSSPLSTSLPVSGLGSTKPSDLTHPLLQGNTASASSAPLTPIDTANPATTLAGNTLDSIIQSAPTTPAPLPQVPQVEAIAQTLAPGTYDISVSASTTPVVTTPLPDSAFSVAATSPPPTPAAAPIPDFVQRVLDLTNRFRATNGLAPLNLNIELDASALGHSQDMALQDYFDHNGLNGSTMTSRMNQVGYTSSAYGENIAAGYDTPEEVVQGWIDSASHRANLLNPSFTDIGIGYYYLSNDTGSNNYYSYWTQDFGGGDLNPASYV